MTISQMLFHLDLILGTKVQPDRVHSVNQAPMTLIKGLNSKELAIFWMPFHPQTSSYLLSQLFVTHLGVVLLFKYEVAFCAALVLWKRL